jgi:uncharacterized protein YjbJ (UPF0337 family)
MRNEWQRMRGDVRNAFDRLNDDDLDYIEGDQDRMLGRLRERYGYDQSQAEEAWNSFMNRSNLNRSYETGGAGHTGGSGQTGTFGQTGQSSQFGQTGQSGQSGQSGQQSGQSGQGSQRSGQSGQQGGQGSGSSQGNR